MLVKNFFRLLGEKLDLAAKTLFTFLIAIIIFGIFAVAIVNTQLKSFKENVTEISIIKGSAKLVKNSIFNQDEAKKNLSDAKRDFNNIVQKNKKELQFSLVYFFIILFSLTTFIQMVKLCIVHVINTFMNSGSRLQLKSIFVSNIFQLLKFGFLATIIEFILFILTICLIIFIFSLIAKTSVFFAMMISSIYLLISVGIIYSILSQWENIIVIKNYGIIKSLSKSIIIVIRNYKKSFLHNIFLTLIANVLFFIFGIFTFGIGFVISAVIIMISFRVLNLIDYYEYNHLPYYINKDTVYYNKNKID